MIFKVVVMLCAIGMNPSDCGRGSADVYLELPQDYPDEIACTRDWQKAAVILSETGHFDRTKQYTKMACMRKHMTNIAKGNVG